jgi:transcriptional regulator with XRE-family HTH domain
VAKKEFNPEVMAQAADRLGLIPAEIARRMGDGTGRAAVGKWLAGETTPRGPTLLRLAQVLGIPVDELLGEKSSELPRLVATVTPSERERVTEAVRKALAEARQARAGEEPGLYFDVIMPGGGYGRMTRADAAAQRATIVSAVPGPARRSTPKTRSTRSKPAKMGGR